MTTVQIASGETRNQLGELAELFGKPRPVLQAAARSARRGMQRHFAARDREPNKLGGKRTHFWNQIRSSTQLGEVTDRQGDILIGDVRFGQKLFGGRIVAKSARALTLPVDPRAHGRRAAVFERETGLKLFLIKPKNKGGKRDAFLATLDANTEKFKIIYLLRTSVTQAPDPRALDRAAVERDAVEGAQALVTAKAQLDQPNQTNP